MSGWAFVIGCIILGAFLDDAAVRISSAIEKAFPRNIYFNTDKPIRVNIVKEQP